VVVGVEGDETEGRSGPVRTKFNEINEHVALAGTFCTLDICISRLEDTGTVDIRGTVERIRAQRAFSIQMPDQYVFCHRALAEYALSRGMLSPQHLAMLPPTIEEDSD
jgi:tyrosine-protein phosphatase non-receptor type 9